jgi:hypothetical protein
MRNVTLHDIRMHSGHLRFETTFTYDPYLSDENYLKGVIQHIMSVKRFQRIRLKNVEVDESRGSFTLTYLYEGYDDDYPLHFCLELARMESKIVVLGHYEHVYHGLFDELIEENVIPDWKERVGWSSAL